jgi:hypothetical protein
MSAVSKHDHCCLAQRMYTMSCDLIGHYIELSSVSLMVAYSWVMVF